MVLSIESVNQSNASRLVSYCAEHGSEHDESFLPGRDFALSPEHPAYLLWKDQSVVGAVILMRTSRYLSVGRGRFSIFHSVLGTQDAYSKLLYSIHPQFHGLRSVYLFIPETKHDTAAILAQLGFHIERFSYVLESKEPAVEGLRFPEGYVVHPLAPSDVAGISQFTQCLNQSFSGLAGHTDSSPDDIRTWFDDERYVDGGICLLRRNEEPIGTICVMREHENRDVGEVFAFGIVDRYRGRGLGRTLLRYARAFAQRKSLHPVMLSVNAENVAALSLYKLEGFVPTETMVCYALDCA